MKRYISLALAAVVLVVSLAVPSYATETGSFDNFDYINVLDYTELGTCRVSGIDPYLVNISLPSSFLITYVDFIVLDRTGGFSSVEFVYNSSTSVPLNVVSLGSNYYRIYGNVYWDTDSISLRFDHGNDGLGWFNFCSFYISTNSLTHFEAPLVCQGFTPVSDVDLSLHTGDNRPIQVIWAIESFEDRAFSFSCFSPEWYKYDYLDIQVIASVSDISSISAVFGEIAIPYTVSNIYPSSTDDNSYCISVRLDLRGLDRSSSEVPEVTIMGQSNYDGANGFLLAGCSGYTIQRVSNPLFYYFKKLTSDLSGFFSNLGFSITGTISEWGHKIVQAINPDTGAADEVIEQGSHVADQVTDLTGQMNSVVKPDLNGGGDISNIISPGDMSSYTVFLSTVVNAPYIGQVVMLSLILSLAGYVLFGKR